MMLECITNVSNVNIILDMFMTPTIDTLLYAEVGKRLRNLRKGRFTQQELSERLHTRGIDLKRASIANIERGRQRIMLHALYELAEVLDTDIHALLPTLAELKGHSSHSTVDTAEVSWARELTNENAGE